MQVSWWNNQRGRWSRGGGEVAVGLWWLAFALFTAVMLMLPYTLNQGMRSKVRSTQSLSNLKQIGLAIQLYAQDNDARLPPMPTTAALHRALQKYGQDKIWQVEELNFPYAVNPSLSLRPLSAYPSPDKTVAIWDTRIFADKYRAVGYLDGHAKIVPQSDWDGLRQASGIVSDVPPPPGPSWWSLRTRDNRERFVRIAFLLAAVAAASLAAWRDAWHWAEHREGMFLGNFAGRFAVRFFGYGFCVMIAALSMSLLLWLVLPVTTLCL